MAAIEDPRLYIKDILTPIIITLDDNVTPADVVVIYEGGPESLRHLFFVNNYDAVITVERHSEWESGETKRIQDVPLRYTGNVPVNAISRDKTGVTATKLLNKIRREIINLIEAAAQGPFPWASRATITVKQTGDAKQITGGYDPLWQDSFVIQFRPYQSEG
jgi:hypothetical protein